MRLRHAFAMQEIESSPASDEEISLYKRMQGKGWTERTHTSYSDAPYGAEQCSSGRTPGGQGSTVADQKYCNSPDVSVLKNKLHERDVTQLNETERGLVQSRILEGSPASQFDVPHFKAIHQHLFKDLYEWAGIEPFWRKAAR